MPLNIPIPKGREQAVLAFVVQEAESILGQNHGYLGRTAIQKIMYFLQVCGVPLRYRFDVYHYGPFCSDILRDADWLMFCEVLKDQSPDPSRYSNYRLAANAGGILKEFEDDLEPHRQTVRSVVKALLPLSPEHLELIATLHYAYRQLKATKESEPEKQAVIERFERFKDDKFDRGDLSKAFDQMQAAGLF